MDIVIDHLTKMYRGGIYALQDVNLTIPGGIFGLLGPNGAGKTTLLRILAGILRPSSGGLQVGAYDGNTESGRTAIKRLLGYLPQELGLYPDLKVAEFLDYIAILKRMDDSRKRRLHVEELLETVALQDVAKRKIKTLSGGMKRRVGIAQALLDDPRLLIVDEPTVGLDPEERMRLRNLLADLGTHRTVLLSTHLVEDIAQICQRMAVLKNGQLLFQGQVTDLIGMARGKVWHVTSKEGKPAGQCTIVSTLNVGTTTHYRVVSETSPTSSALSVAPTLEESYMWLMHHASATETVMPISPIPAV